MQEEIKEAKERFHKGLPIEKDVIREEILASWQRSRSFGLEPDKPDKRILSREELNRRIADRQAFYDIAVPFMESLSAFTTGSGFLTVISDEDGYALRIIGDPDILETSSHDFLVEGCNRSERRLGTNGIGTPLESGKPIQIFGREHYYDVRVNWVCSGAPIFDNGDRIVGCFCIIGTNDKVSFHTLGMAAAAAEAITRQLKMKAAYDIINVIRDQMNVMIEYVPSGLLLLNDELVVKHANDLAANLLGFERAELDGLTFQQLFGRNSLGQDELATGFSDKQVSVYRHGRIMNLSLSLIVATSDTYVATFERMETLHKKINRIIGSEARFTFDDVIGASPALRNSIELAKTAANSNSNVLLQGESGTGKELFAQAIHNASDRCEGPFVAINCGALPKSLVESELFGYEEGSFTGAKRGGCAGKFELADCGTIFLDEIGDMPIDVQTSLLRVLQNREIVRIGGNKTRKIDVRIIAATNKDLLAAVTNQTFRGDLYYRLNVFNIMIPPLRDRADDIRLLADFFLNKYSEYASGPILGFKDEVYALMRKYPWPGNIRELENAVERTLNIVKMGWIGAEGLPSTVIATHSGGGRDNKPSAETGCYSIRTTEKKQILEAIKAAGGNITRAAEMLEISRRTMYRKIDKYGIKNAEL